MSLKEIVDSYLLNHDLEIAKAKEEKDFKWLNISASIDLEHNLKTATNPEYVRSRYRYLNKAKWINWKDRALDELEEQGKKLFKDNTNSAYKEVKGKFIYTSGKEDKTTGKKEWTFTASNIPTEQEIIEYFNIDTTKWKIVNVYHKTSFGGKYSITVQTNLLKGVDAVDYKKEFEEFIKNHNLSVLNRPIIKKLEQSSKFEKRNSVLLNLSDLHCGKLSWDKEVGADYDVDLAKKVFLEALQNLAYQSIRCFGVEEFVLNIGGDFLHTNGSTNTTANGTIMNDVDSRYQKIFSKGLEILTEAVDFLASFEGVNVKLYIVQGNHDLATSFYLGESIKAFYRKSKNIEVINDPHIRKYYKYGVTSYMLTHGDCKEDGLPLTFATEKPDYFAQSLYRYIFLGHLHKTSRKSFLTENEVNGIVLRRLNSLSPTDAWHNSNNFVGAKRMANALIFDKENGQIAEFNYIVKK